MKANDDYIKKTLQDNIQRIYDDSFTKSVVILHLAKRKNIKNKPFVNFLPMLIGLSSVIISIGLVYIMRQKYEWIHGIVISEQNGLILVTLSIIFLIYKLIEEFTAPNMIYR